jgi:hypothetical protein
VSGSIRLDQRRSEIRQDHVTLKERIMFTLRKNVATLFVDRSSQQWIVLDHEGNYWVVPSDRENPWDQRQPFSPTEETELEQVPGHYKSMLGLPV